jgi:hypothetical protein
MAIPEADTKSEGDDANDSGYHSDIIYEEDEGSDPSERSLSPKTVAPQQAQTKASRHGKHNSTSHRSLARKPSWNPNLKRDLSTEYAFGLSRRDSIDSLLSHPDDSIRGTASLQHTTMEKKWNPTDRRSSCTPTARHPNTYRDRSCTPTPTARHPNTNQDRSSTVSTLLHPSTPDHHEQTTGHAHQVALAFSSPQLIQVRRSSSMQVAPRRKTSTLLHPSSPVLGPITETHPADENKTPRPSSLLHTAASAPAMVFKTIISVPPQHAPMPRMGRTSSLLRRDQALDRMPLLKSTMSEPVSETMAGLRRKSVLHSCLSDEEDDEVR